LVLNQSLATLHILHKLGLPPDFWSKQKMTQYAKVDRNLASKVKRLLLTAKYPYFILCKGDAMFLLL